MTSRSEKSGVSSVLVNLALLPFALVGLLLLGTCALCVAAPFIGETTRTEALP